MSVLKGTTSFYDYSISDIIEHNLRQMLIYGLIERGAYTTVPLSSSYAILQNTSDPRFGVRKMYEGMGPSWVWQSGVAVPNGYTRPFLASGVYVNNVFYPTSTSGAYAHTIDYEHGRVIFNSSLPVGSVVKCEYVFNDIAVCLTNEKSWKTIVNDYLTKFLQASTTAPSGISSSIKEDRVWLPAVFIEVRGLADNKGLQLGGGEVQTFDAYFHIFAEEPKTRNALMDLLNDQIQHTVDLYNINTAPFNFTSKGALASDRKEYPSLASRNGAHFFTYCKFIDTDGQIIQNTVGIFRGESHAVLEIDRYLSTY